MNVFDVDEQRPRLWQTPSHVDVYYEKRNVWATWELGGSCIIGGRPYKLVDVYKGDSDVLVGVFRIGSDSSTTKDVALQEMYPPPQCRLTPVYNVRRRCREESELSSFRAPLFPAGIRHSHPRRSPRYTNHDFHSEKIV
jgi:hypothetical protein